MSEFNLTPEELETIETALEAFLDEVHDDETQMVLEKISRVLDALDGKSYLH